MLFNYFIIVMAASSVSLTWRALKDDHPAFKRWVKDLPLIGEALTCGFCASLWFTLAAVLIFDPLTGIVLPFTFSWGFLMPLVHVLVSWLSVGAGVLLVRSAIVVLLESGGVLKHRHQVGHISP